MSPCADCCGCADTVQDGWGQTCNTCNEKFHFVDRLQELIGPPGCEVRQRAQRSWWLTCITRFSGLGWMTKLRLSSRKTKSLDRSLQRYWIGAEGELTDCYRQRSWMQSGMNYEDAQHVANYSMPSIKNYFVSGVWDTDWMNDLISTSLTVMFPSRGARPPRSLSLWKYTITIGVYLWRNCLRYITFVHFHRISAVWCATWRYSFEQKTWNIQSAWQFN